MNLDQVSQSFQFHGSDVRRNIHIDGMDFVSSLPQVARLDDPVKSFYTSYLGKQKPTHFAKSMGRITYIDLFCGGGGLSLGVSEALSTFGFQPKPLVAVDIDNQALKLADANFSPIVKRSQSVEELIKYSVDLSQSINDFITQPVILDQQIAQFKGKTDLLIGGPPCQGHSNLNNKTRRNDPRNLLYFVMPAFAVAMDIPCVIIENVRSITRASENVVGITSEILRTHGYFVEEKVVSALDFGVAQTRTRHFLIATKVAKPRIAEIYDALKVDHLTFDDVIGQGLCNQGFSQLMISEPELSEVNRSRIDYLFDNSQFNLPDPQRPDCHRDGNTYPSVYGRLQGDQPLYTITTGFGSPGRGRFIHPHQRRTINAREAGRAQAFPDWYWNSIDELNLTKNSLYKIIGDAVPSLMVVPLVASILESINAKALRAAS